MIIELVRGKTNKQTKKQVMNNKGIRLVTSWNYQPDSFLLEI